MLNESEFGVRIRMTAETAGAENAKKAVHELKGEIEGTEVNTRALHTALSAISPQLGEIAHIAHLTEFGAAYAGALAFGKALEMVTEQEEKEIENTNKIAEGWREIIRLREEAADKSILTAKVEEASWNRAREAIRIYHDEIKERLDENIHLYEKATASANGLAEAIERQTKAQIALAQATGQMGDEEAQRRKDEAEQLKADRQEAAKEAEARLKIEDQTKAVGERQTAQSGYESDAGRITKERDQLQFTYDQAAVDLDEKKQDLKDQKKERAELKTSIQHFNWKDAGWAVLGKSPAEALAGLRKQYDEKSTQVETTEAAIRKDVEHQSERTLLLDKLNNKLKQLTDWIDEASKSIHELTVTIANAKTDLQNMQSDYTQTRAMNQQTAATNRVAAGGYARLSAERGSALADDVAEVYRRSDEVTQQYRDYEFNLRTLGRDGAGGIARELINRVNDLAGIVAALMQNKHLPGGSHADLGQFDATIDGMRRAIYEGFQ